MLALDLIFFEARRATRVIPYELDLWIAGAVAAEDVVVSEGPLFLFSSFVFVVRRLCSYISLIIMCLWFDYIMFADTF